MQEKKQEIYKIHCFYMGKIKKNDNLIIKDLMSSYKSRDLGSTEKMMVLLPLNLIRANTMNRYSYAVALV